ncbi:MAG TPA: hypothetical protein VM692_04930 [Gammaproteobacteria bacterium]|nr:hypothetical protein [Gammaproteobacteria bacterium]
MKGHWVAAAVAATLLRTAPAAAQSSGCDRACLEGLLDAYVDAVVAHEPQRLPSTADVKFTENGQRLALGDGLWHTASGRGGYALKLADVERGQAVLMGTIREAEAPTVLVARLGVVNRRVAELETLVIRDAEVAERLDAIGAPRAAWSEPVPAAQRQSRAALVESANKYFSGIERNDGRGDYPLAADCARLENGLVLAGDVALVSPRAQGRPNGGQVGCLEQFRSGIFFYVTRIRDRRFVLVDTERSVVFAFAFFDNAGGDSRFGTLPDGRRVESGPKIPWTWAIAEVFKIERGLIGPVESVLQQVPYGMGSGWSTWQESLSSEPRD